MNARRWTITATVTTASELHLGGVGGHETADDALARDGAGRLVIPGTSLAGVLRRAVDLEPALVNHWFGPENADHAARVWVSDAVETTEATVIDTRTHVGIDRFTGAAKDGILYTTEVVPPGVGFGVEIRVVPLPSDPATNDARTVVSACIAALHSLSVGAKTGSGRGRLAVRDVMVRYSDLSTPAGVLAALRGQDPVDADLGATPARPALAGNVVFRLPWRPDGPVQVTESWADHEADRGPITSSCVLEDGSVGRCFVIPGTSVRGAMRSHAERIVRTLTGVRTTPDEAFIDQVRAGDMEALVHLFGAAGAEEDDACRGAISVSDVRSAPFDAALWRKVRNAEKRTAKNGSERPTERSPAAVAVDKFNESLHGSTGLWLDLVTRNAIDRWTGGTKDAVLFGTVEVHADRLDTWQPIEITFTPGGTDTDLASLALLTITLRDLVDGWIALGHGTTRGAGAVTIDPAAVEVSIGAQARIGDRPPAATTCAWTEWLDLLDAAGGQAAWTEAVRQARTKETA